MCRMCVHVCVWCVRGGMKANGRGVHPHSLTYPSPPPHTHTHTNIHSTDGHARNEETRRRRAGHRWHRVPALGYGRRPRYGDEGVLLHTRVRNYRVVEQRWPWCVRLYLHSRIILYVSLCTLIPLLISFSPRRPTPPPAPVLALLWLRGCQSQHQMQCTGWCWHLH